MYSVEIAETLLCGQNDIGSTLSAKKSLPSARNLSRDGEVCLNAYQFLLVTDARSASMLPFLP